MIITGTKQNRIIVKILGTYLKNFFIKPPNSKYYLAIKVNLLSLESTKIVCKGKTSPFKIISEISSSIYFWIALLSGLAPYFKSVPLSKRNCFALSDTLSFISLLSKALEVSFNNKSIICNSCSFVKLSKITISSTLFKNSGLKISFKADSTFEESKLSFPKPIELLFKF